MKLLLPLALLATLALSESAKQRLRSPRRGNRNVHRREKSAKGAGGGRSGSGDTGGIGNRVDEAFGGDGACDESAETQPFSIVASAKNQEPELVEYDNQCYSACDCESRCCSNYPYYIQFDSYFSGVSNRAGPKGGVCVELSESFTGAALEPSCSYGFRHIGPNFDRNSNDVIDYQGPLD